VFDCDLEEDIDIGKCENEGRVRGRSPEDEREKQEDSLLLFDRNHFEAQGENLEDTSLFDDSTREKAKE